MYCKDGTTIGLREFQQFLRDEQQDPLGEDEYKASAFIRDYLRDPQRDVCQPYFTLSEVWTLLCGLRQTDIAWSVAMT